MWFTTVETDGFIRFSIGNEGPPIPKENQPKLFDAFFTNGKRGGTGLGLAIAHKVVLAHGGRIWCESAITVDRPNGMVEFFFTLPIADGHKSRTNVQLVAHSSDVARALHAAAASQEETVSATEEALERNVKEAGRGLGRNLKVLIVDDEAVYRNSLASYLDKRGKLSGHVELLQATCGEDAIKLASEVDFDLIVSDVDLGPGSMSGFELVRKIREDLCSRAMISIHSNRICASDHQEALSAGASSFLPKPMGREQLLRLVLSAASHALPVQDSPADSPPEQASEDAAPQDGSGGVAPSD
jgi:CheY-like chemotaxis protein